IIDHNNLQKRENRGICRLLSGYHKPGRMSTKENFRMCPACLTKYDRLCYILIGICLPIESFQAIFTGPPPSGRLSHTDSPAVGGLPPLLIGRLLYFISWLLHNRNAFLRKLVKQSIKSSKSIVAI